MEDLSFLDHLSEDYGSSDAILKAVVADGQVCLISDRISPYRLLDSCPLLYHAFEYGYQSRLQASIEAPSRAAIISLLRYCYTGSYLPPGSEYAPILFLPHAETYKIAEDLDVPELQLLAHGNFSVQVNCACSMPIPPDDLVETIRYVYTHFASSQSREQQGLARTLLNYCVSVFQYHGLGESVAFLDIAKQIPEFRQDLCRVNMERNFEDDCKQSHEDEGFSIVHRPKPLASATPNDLMPSSEAVTTNPTDILAMTGSYYPDDDDDWTML
ncbi:hypothetical protein GQ44DRAFT_602730 [Phaeosphaeriaceae sp. PMI808]|nr:hypothetical protein GQ44DRAFT_602730 [Phaeosphaeriaceae sp. PMI808]